MLACRDRAGAPFMSTIVIWILCNTDCKLFNKNSKQEDWVNLA